MTGRRQIRAQWRYFKALARRFRVTAANTFVLFVLAPLAYRALYPLNAAGEPLTVMKAVHHVYFLLFGQPSLDFVERWPIELMNLVIPPFGIAVVVDGVVRFAYLFFAKKRSDREWVEVMSQVYEGHVIICGAGRIGYRVAEQLRALGRDVIVIEKKEDGPFVGMLRDAKVLVLADDIKNAGSLRRANIQAAEAIVAATDDDLANMNVALDARRENPKIRVVMRLFDDDLVAKVRDAFKAEALSSSALAAPAMALSALDPRVIHSFQVDGRLMVVSHFTVKKQLTTLTTSNLREMYGALTLSIQRAGGEILHNPSGNTALGLGDVLTLQASWRDYQRVREFTGEAAPPLSSQG